MQIGDAVGQARSEMQQGRGGFAGHRADAVGGAGADAFEQGKHRFHARHAVERLHQMHFGSAGIGDAIFDAAIGQGFDQGLGAVHGESFVGGGNFLWALSYCFLLRESPAWK